MRYLLRYGHRTRDLASLTNHRNPSFNLKEPVPARWVRYSLVDLLSMMNNRT